MMEGLPKRVYSHSLHTAVVAQLLSMKLQNPPEGMSKEIFSRSVWQGGFYHHLGERILLGPDKTMVPAATVYLLEKHLQKDGFVNRDTVLEIARYHGECVDGSGCPDGLCGEQIPLAARLVGFAGKLDELLVGRGGNSKQRVLKSAGYMHANGTALYGRDVMECFDMAQTEIIDLYLSWMMRGSVASKQNACVNRRDASLRFPLKKTADA